MEGKTRAIGWALRRYLRSETTEPVYAERQSASAIDPYAFQLSGRLKTEAAKSRKQRRSLKQRHEDLSELGFWGSYDRVGRSPGNEGGGKRSGSIPRANEHLSYPHFDVEYIAFVRGVDID